MTATAKRAPQSSSSWLLAFLAITGTMLAFLQYILDLEPSGLKIPSKDRWINSRESTAGAGEQQLRTDSNSNIAAVPRPDYYLVFSTSCSEQMDWESFVLFYHALKVGQPGNVTRIVSGCSPRGEVELRAFHANVIQRMSDRFHVHFTPNYSTVKRTEQNQPYKYMNKPFGLRHWMEHVLGLEEGKVIPERLQDSIVMLLDPDMVLVRPLVHDFSNEHVLWVKTDPATKVVKHGYPVAQHDGYLHNEWMPLNFSYITNRSVGAYVTRPPEKDGPLYWNTGPPYLATVKDMYNIAIKWTELAPRIMDIYPRLFTEMYGFIIASVQLRLPFTLIRSLVVSDPTQNHREGWPYVDELHRDQVCQSNASAKLPIGLHYCKRYHYGEWFFSKYRIKKNIMRCDKPILQSPPSDLLGKYDYAVTPPRVDGTVNTEVRTKINDKQAKREVYMLCGMIKAVNEALRYYKLNFCKGEVNLNETYSVHTDPTAHW